MEIYEKEIEYLQTQLMRINTMKFHSEPSSTQWRLANTLFNDNEKYQTFSQQLQEEFLRIHALVSEANMISNEMQQQVVYKVILQIPISYLKPNERTMDNLCEVAIQVKQGDSLVHIWDIEKFQFRFNEMKDIYQNSKNQIQRLKKNNPFLEKKSERFIGVANIYLKALFYGSKLDYIVPIINTQGEICGSLHVVLDQTESSSMKTLSDFQINSTTRGSMSEGISADIDEKSLSNSQPSLEDEGIEEFSTLSIGKNEQITVKFAIKEVRDIPKTDAEHVICRYTFINPKLDQTIVSNKSSGNDLEQKTHLYSFDHENEYTFPITDHFLSTCLESAVSIEVWYQYKSQLPSIDPMKNNELNQRNREVRRIGQRWKDVKRHVQFFVEIQELDSMGQWGPVEVDAQEQILSGGVYRLKQGQSKRLVTQLRILPRSDPLPLSIHAIRSVEIGSISTRKIDAPRQLDSYQDEDLQYLKHEWLNLIEKRKLDLESQVKFLNEQPNKTPADIRKEQILLEQLLHLVEERNIAVLPPPASGIPGAPAAWDPPPTIEMHRPLIFLNINTSNETAGLQAMLNEEDNTKMLALPLIQNASDDIRAIAVWDPAIHESTAMNQVTPQDTLIYLIVKIVVLISEPVQMEVVLRKRIAVSISKSEGWWPEKTFKNLLGYTTYKRTSVVYELVSNIPKTLHPIEEQNNTDAAGLSPGSIEKYIHYASAIDVIVLLDKLRQEVLLVEKSAKQQTIRKATSAPNITAQKRRPNVFYSPANSRRENQLALIPSEPKFSLSESELNISTPSMTSRSLFIEEEQIQPVQTSTFQIKHTIDLEENKLPDEENTLERKYSLTPSLSLKEILPNNDHNEDFSIGCQVIVNTGHSIFNKVGIIHFIGEISTKEGIWYGIELKEPVGKNNGSLNGKIYFQCPDKHGVFVRRDKIRLLGLSD